MIRATKALPVLSAGDYVADTRNPYRVVTGVVVETRGTMYRDTMVNVRWDHLGYSNWELPGTLTLISNNAGDDDNA